MKRKIIQLNVLAVLIGIALCTILVSAQVFAQRWENNPANCQAGYPEYSGQNCGTTEACGVLSGFVQCYDTDSLSPPSSNSANSIVDYSSSFDGGYGVNCTATADSGSPYCNNNGTYWCDRNETFFNTLKRKTVCVANKWASDTGATQEGECRDLYLNCDGGGITSSCEVLSGNTVFSGISNANYYDDGSNDTACSNAQCTSNYCYMTVAPGTGNDTCTVAVGTACTVSGDDGQYMRTGARGQCTCQSCADVGKYAWEGGCYDLTDILADLGGRPWKKVVQSEDQLVDGTSGGIRADGEITITSASAFAVDDTITVTYGNSVTYTLIAKNGSPARASCQFDMSLSTTSAIAEDILDTIQTPGCTDSDSPAATPFLTYSFVEGSTVYLIHDTVNVNGTLSTDAASGVDLTDLKNGKSASMLTENEAWIIEQEDISKTWDANTSTWVKLGGGIDGDVLPPINDTYFIGSGEPLDNTADIAIEGIASSGLGWSTANAGDVNGDGYDDIIIGTNGKGAYVFFGSSLILEPSIENADVWLAPTGSTFGLSVSSAGDVNNDGYADVIVGEYGYSSNTGRAYIYYGGSSMDSTADVILTGLNAGDKVRILSCQRRECKW